MLRLLRMARALKSFGSARLLTIVFLSAAASLSAQSTPPVQRPESACGPLSVRFATHTRYQAPPGRPAAGKARIYVVEDWMMPDEPLTINPTIRIGEVESKVRFPLPHILDGDEMITKINALH
jgi:hypothetical protein